MNTNSSEMLSRREMLRFSLSGAGVLAWGSSSRRPWATPEPVSLAAPRSVQRLLVINCSGGYDGLNMLVPINNAAYYARRPTVGIAPANGLVLAGANAYRLHPAFQNVQSLFNVDQRVAVIKKVGYPSANLSHFESQEIMSHGIRGDFQGLGIPASGWIARFADAYATDSMGIVAVGAGRPLDFEGGNTNPFMVKKLADFRYEADSSYQNNHVHRLEVVRRLLSSFSGEATAQEAATALSQGHQFADQIKLAVESYQAAPGVEYPTSSPGRYLKDVATLIQSGFPTRIFFTGLGGWDTHGDQGSVAGRQADLIARLDQALGAFVSDLKGMNVWSETLILVVSEFGRRNFENSSGGTDHGHGNVMFALGGAVNGGLYGPDYTETEIAEERYLDYAIDFRDVYKEAVARHLGHDPAPIFPEPQETNNTVGYL